MNLKIKTGIQKIKTKFSSFSLKKKIIFGILILLIGVGTFYLFLANNNEPEPEKETTIVNPYKEDRKVTGGNPNEFIDYYDGAITAWKSGDKVKAKELAKKGLEINEQLTPEQQEKIPDQSDKSYDLYDITKDLYEQD